MCCCCVGQVRAAPGNLDFPLHHAAHPPLCLAALPFLLLCPAGVGGGLHAGSAGERTVRGDQRAARKAAAHLKASSSCCARFACRHPQLACCICVAPLAHECMLAHSNIQPQQACHRGSSHGARCPSRPNCSEPSTAVKRLGCGMRVGREGRLPRLPSADGCPWLLAGTATPRRCIQLQGLLLLSSALMRLILHHAAPAQMSARPGLLLAGGTA